MIRPSWSLEVRLILSTGSSGRMSNSLATLSGHPTARNFSSITSKKILAFVFNKLYREPFSKSSW